jgi:hypothetical protein
MVAVAVSPSARHRSRGTRPPGLLAGLGGLLVMAVVVGCGTSRPARRVVDDGPPPAELRVLLIGNSQLGFFGDHPAPPDVTVALADVSTVAHGGATRLVVGRAQVPGVGCAGFADVGDGPGTPLREAADPSWDVVLLVPSIDETDAAASAPCWDRFRAVVEDAGNRFGIVATAHVSDAWPTGFDALDEAVRSWAADRGVLFVPAGATWRRLLGDAPTSEALFALYHGDLAHPGPEGSYLYVLALYGALSGRSVVDAGIDNDVPALRCDPRAPCLTEDEMRACLDDAGGWQCPPTNGAVFSNHRVHFVTDAEAAAYQAVVDAVLAER